MKKQMKLFTALAAAATMTLGSAFASMAANQGWVDVQNYYYYYDENGNMATNQWVASGENYFWMNADGRMAVQDWMVLCKCRRRYG